MYRSTPRDRATLVTEAVTVGYVPIISDRDGAPLMQMHTIELLPFFLMRLQTTAITEPGHFRR
jgi:hypothetical protein